MRTRTGTSDRAILILSTVVLALLAAISFAIAPVESSPGAPGSSFSTEPSGTRAAYLVLRELGHDIGRSFEPIASLRSEPSSTILVLANPFDVPSKGDQQAILTFVRHGGTVIAYGLSAAAFLPGVTPDRQRGPGQEFETLVAALPGHLTRGTRELSARRFPRPSLDPAYVPVYGSADNPAVVTARFGDGEVIWCLDETLIQNDGVRRGSNVNLITNAAGLPGARTIAWDEYYHGQRRSLWSYVAGTPLFWGFAQLGLAAVAFFAGASRRRGPVRFRFLEPRTSPLEFVDTMASLYERGGDARSAVDGIRQRFRRRLAVMAGVSTSTGDQQLAAAAAPRIGLDPDRTRLALAGSADALRQGVNGKAAVAIVADLQQLQARAQARRGRA